MNPKLRKFIVFLLVGLLFIEFGFQYVQSEKQAAEESPIDKKGKIKDGETISVEEEEEMAINSFPSIDAEEYAENMLFTFGQCLLSAKGIGENAYICISNNVSNKAIPGLSTKLDSTERGQFIYDNLANGHTITNISSLPIPKKNNLTFKLTISLNYDSEITSYEVQIKKNKIVSFKKKQGEKR